MEESEWSQAWSQDILITSWRAALYIFPYETRSSEKSSNDLRTSTKALEPIKMFSINKVQSDKGGVTNIIGYKFMNRKIDNDNDIYMNQIVLMVMVERSME